jgi:hypothetical protein
MATIGLFVVPILIVIFIVLLLRSPKYLFFFILLVRPFIELFRINNSNEQLRLIVNGIGIIVPACLFLLMVVQNQIFKKHNLIIMLFMIAILLSTIINEPSARSFEMAVRIISPFVFLMFPQTIIKTEDDLRNYFRIIAISSIFVLLAVALDWERTNIHSLGGWIQGTIATYEGGAQPRMAAVFGVPTTTAFWLFQFYAVSFFLFTTEKRLIRWPYLLLCLLILIPIYFTYSRAAWLGCFVLVILYLFLLGHHRKALAVGAAITGLSVFMLPNILLRIQSLDSVQSRIIYWIGYVRMVFSQGLLSSLFGVGWVGLPDKNLFSGDIYDAGSTGIVENSFIFLLAGAGVISIAIFTIIFFKLARKAILIKKKGKSIFIRKYAAWCIGMISAWLIMSMSGDLVSYVIINWYFYAFFGGLLAIARNSALTNNMPAMKRKPYPMTNKNGGQISLESGHIQGQDFLNPRKVIR